MSLATIRKKGQAIIAVTLGLFAICGMVGLAVDLGWSFYLRRTMQAAADAAALASARDALVRNGGSTSYVCGTNLTCAPTPAACASPVPTPTTNLEAACAYASKNGFVNTSPQQVTVQADVPATTCTAGAPATPPTCIPGVGGVEAFYWVTVRIQQTVPQLFSRFFGQSEGLVAAKATAALTSSTVIGSLILLNREGDPAIGTGPDEMPAGMNLIGQGGPMVNVPGGIIMASQCAGGGDCDNRYAGELGGSGSSGGTGGGGGNGNGNGGGGDPLHRGVNSPFTYIRGTGMGCASNVPGCGTGGWGSSLWTAIPQNGADNSVPLDSPLFNDPFGGRGQPPINTNINNIVAYEGGLIAGGTEQNPTILSPGNYVATANGTPTLDPIRLGSGHFRFGDCTSNYFGDFHFWGGVTTSGGNATVTFGSGRYVFAGVKDGLNNGELFDIDNGTILQDCGTPGQENALDHAGEIFIFTDYKYPQLQSSASYTAVQSLINARSGTTPITALNYGSSGFKMGANDNSQINLHGMNRENAEVQSRNLHQFAPVVLWQDQQNSRVGYNAAGYPDSGDTNLPPAGTNDQLMYLSANANVQLYGAAYQPRGAAVLFSGGSPMSGPLMVVSGALEMQGGPDLTLTGPTNPITKLTAALVR